MLLSRLRCIQPHYQMALQSQKRLFRLNGNLHQTAKPQEAISINRPNETSSQAASSERIIGELFPTARVVPMVLTKEDPIVLSFDEVPGPKSLKYLSSFRNYLSVLGTQITASALTLGLSVGTYISTRKPIKNLSVLFDEYGPVVRFVSPVGGDIVLVNHPDHIQKVYTLEGEYPVRSTLDSLEKYRKERRSHLYAGLFTSQGQEWSRQRSVMYSPLSNAANHHLDGINDVCDNFVQKVYNLRNHQDEIAQDLYGEIHKWAFDCMGLILFSKRFTMLDTELVYSQCDMSWLYHSLEKATKAIMKCESGLQLWKLFTTPAWSSLVKYCDSMDNLIGKHVLEAEQAISFRNKDDNDSNSFALINSLLLADEKMSAEDISTVIMDMLLIGVNTITSSTSFLIYHLAKHQKCQKKLYNEIQTAFKKPNTMDIKNIRNNTPYLQACIKETLRLVPPIPILTRILPKNIILDRYNIPRGTLIIMSTQEASLKESNFENAKSFQPERWLTSEAKDYHAFASIPFGYGSRKCLGQNIAETMMSMIVVKLLEKYKLEYHYGDIEAKRTFITKPNRPLKVRFLDRV